jgi:hypothetical protein
MATPFSSVQKNQLAARVRQQLVDEASKAMEALLNVVQERLTALMNEAAPSREMQLRRDAWTLYQRQKNAWREATLKAWQTALKPVVPRATRLSLDGAFELVGTEVVENKIVASRLALGIMEKAAGEVNDLRKRLKFLNGERDLNPQDIAHPETLTLPLVEQWVVCGLSREFWFLINEVVQQHLNAQLQQIYAHCNAELIEHDVLPVIEFAAKVNSESMSQDQTDADPVKPDSTGTRSSQRPTSASATSPSQRSYANSAPPDHGKPSHSGSGSAHGHGHSDSSGTGYVDVVDGNRSGRSMGSSRPRSGRVQKILDRVSQLITGTAPQSKFDDTVYQAASDTLLVALAQQPKLGDAYFNHPLTEMTAGPVVIQRVASELRQQTAELKEQAQNDSEKAIIELVALMFQSILQEDRIPTGIRVWFARLQMPVLRVALAEPDFFNKLDHPARQLIDHMGSCVMGFDASGISSDALETEIKRVVQVIEQYPETGDRVYRRVYEEFLEFLKKHLTQKAVTQKVMGVAQQVEQKETLTIQYTIELRNQIKDMPVREEIREFLFKVWAEVLAVAAVRQGAQHEETLLLKKTATDLIWAASAKPNRADRARVIADLPDLLQCLRSGMSLLGVVKAAQEAHIKIISDILADAFMSKTQAIAVDQIQALAERLAHLEDYCSDDGTEELPLDAQNIEGLLGIDASDLEVITSGGGKASAVMMEWARDLDLGAWFRLDHNTQIAQVQYVWRSPLGHLHLFASAVGRSYLIQTARLAAYLQAGLLEPQEEESLTVRATRDALGKLEANPERLLS